MIRITGCARGGTDLPLRSYTHPGGVPSAGIARMPNCAAVFGNAGLALNGTIITVRRYTCYITINASERVPFELSECRPVFAETVPRWMSVEVGPRVQQIWTRLDRSRPTLGFERCVAELGEFRLNVARSRRHSMHVTSMSTYVGRTSTKSTEAGLGSARDAFVLGLPTSVFDFGGGTE